MLFSGNKKFEIDMCSGAILPKMLLFALPLMFSSMLQLFFNAADVMVVGRFAGDHSLAAVGSNSSIVGLLTNLFIGISVGSNVIAARFYGAKDEESLSKTLHTSIVLGIGSGLILTVIGVVFARKILVMMQTPPEVLELASLYLVIYFLGMTAMMVYNFGSAVLRAVGDTRRPMIFLIIAGVINVLLNLFFVINLKLDVAGVAIATVISQIVSALLVLRCLMHESGGIHLDLSKLRIDRIQLGQILRIGLPAGVQGILFSISNIVIQSSINSFGAVVMAGNAAAANVDVFIYFAMNAFYQAIISFTSQNFGAGRIKRIFQVLGRGLACIAAIGTVLGLLAVYNGRLLLGIYTSSPAVIDAGMIRLWFVAAPYAICGLMDGMVGVLRGLGYSTLPTIVSFVGVCCLRLVWLAAIFNVGFLRTIEMVYISYPATWIITFFAHLFCFRFIMKKRFHI